MVQSIAEEEEQKKKLVEEQKVEITEKLDQVFEMNKFSVQKALVEHEFFKDNNTLIKRQATKIERARKAEEKANEVLEQIIPKLEAVAGGENDNEELTAETIVEKMVVGGPMGEIGHKIIKYQSKEKAI